MIFKPLDVASIIRDELFTDYNIIIKLAEHLTGQLSGSKLSFFSEPSLLMKYQEACKSSLIKQYPEIDSILQLEDFCALKTRDKKMEYLKAHLPEKLSQQPVPIAIFQGKKDKSNFVSSPRMPYLSF